MTTIGYAARVASVNDVTSRMTFIIQSTLIVLAPAFFAATVYMLLGRVIRYLRSPHLSFVPIRWLTAIFVTGDVISFMVQGGGAGFMSAGNASSQHTGSLIIVGGLIVQLIFFGIFFAALITFDVRCRRLSLYKRIVSADGSTRLQWHPLIWALYVASTLISIRCVFRAIEFATGYDGYLQTHEVYFYVFDSLPMFATMVIFNIVVPGIALKGGIRQLDDVELTLRK